jgi:WD40 repeat protein
LGQIADDFTRRRRLGERPQIAEYQQRHPQAAQLLGEVLPLLLAIPSPSKDVTPHSAEADAAIAGTFAGYEILAELGRGGMGIVWKAKQPLVDRVVALKMVLAGSFARDEDKARFHGEMEAIARLQHPGIVQIYEVGEEQGRAFFSQEFCAGGSLDKKLAATPMVPRDAVILLENLARAVQAAHEAQVVHRDLKPANVLLDAEGSPKIADFGLAKRLDVTGQTASGAIVGTPAYMSPEQAQGLKIGPATDIYSLGAILYECLTGRPPFRAATTYDTILQVIEKDPVAPTQLVAGVPRDVETICLKCLHKDPARRYACASDLADDLQRWQKGEPIHARQVGTLERTLKWCRRHPAITALLGLLASVVGIAFAVIMVFYSDAVEQRSVAERKTEVAEREEQAARDAEGLAKAATIEAQAEKKIADEQRQLAQRQLKRTELALYANQLQSALREYEAGNSRGAWRHLERCDKELRGIEYHLMTRLLSPTPHREESLKVNHMSTTWDGQKMIVANGTRINIHDLQQDQQTHRLDRKFRAVHEVAANRDGSRLLVVDDSEEQVTLLHGPNWKLKRVMQNAKSTVANVYVAMDESGTRAVGTNGLQIRVWDTETGNVIRTLRGHTGGPRGIALSPDGKRFVSISLDRSVKIWDADTGKLLHKFTFDDLTVPECVAISRDGSRVVVGYQTSLWRMWDMASGQLLLTRSGHALSVRHVCWSVDGKQFATADATTLKIWDSRTGEELLIRRAEQTQIQGVAFIHAGTLLYSGGLQKLKLWTTTRGQDLPSLVGHTDRINGLCIAPDGSRVVSCSRDETIRVWDWATATELFRLQSPGGEPLGVSISRDGTHIAAVSREAKLRIWDAKTGEMLRTIEHSHKVPGTTLAFSPDGKQIVTAGGHNIQAELRGWNVETGQALWTLLDRSGIKSIAFTPDSKHILTGRLNGEVQLHDANNGKVLRTLTTQREIVDAKGKRIVRGHAVGQTAVVCSEDHKTILTGGGDRFIRLWSPDSATERLALQADSSISALAVNPDASRMLSASYNSMLTLWETQYGQPLLPIKAHIAGILQIAATPDLKRFVSAGNDGKIHLWDATPLPEINPDK